MKYCLTFLAFTAVLLSPAAAQTNPPVRLDPIIVTGSPDETTSFNVPYSVDAARVNPTAIAQPGVNVSEALVGVPGLVIQNRQNYAQDLQISIRGFGARSAFGVRGVKLIADGIPATNPDGQGQAATFNLDTAERIEVLRGPFATIYGNHAGGVIQLFSRDGQGDPLVRANVFGGSWGTIKVGAGSEGEVKGVGYVFDISRFETDGYRDHSAAVRNQIFAKMHFAPDEHSRVTVVANGLHQPGTQDPLGLTFATYQTDPRAAEAVAETFNTRKNIDHGQVGGTYERHLNDNNRVEMQAYAGRRSVVQFLSIPPAPQTNNAGHSGGVVDFDRDFHGTGARWIGDFEPGPGSLTLTAGLDFDRSQDDRRGYENFVGTTLGVRGNLRRDEIDTVFSVGPYLQGVWDQDKWQFSAGVRHSWVRFDVDDHYLANGDESGSVEYNHTTPAVGVLYRAHPKVHVYGSAGAGFETPTLNELSYSTNTGGFNFDLKPARSLQGELGIKALITDSTRVNAAVFQINTEDEIVVAAASNGRTSFMNAPGTLRQGFELGAESDLTRHFTAKGSFTWLRAIYDEDFTSPAGLVEEGNRIPGIPEFAAYGELAWHPIRGFNMAVETVYREKVYVEDLNTQRAAPNHFLVNLRCAAEQTCGRWTFSELLRLDNVTDQKHVSSVIIGDGNGRFYEPGPELSVYAGVQVGYRF